MVRKRAIPVQLLVWCLWGGCLGATGCQTCETCSQEGKVGKGQASPQATPAQDVGVLSPYLPRPYIPSEHPPSGEPGHGPQEAVDPAFLPDATVLPGDGCEGSPKGCKRCPPPKTICDLPRELQKTSFPTYVIEPPDILLIDALRAIPKPPYKIEPQDTIIVYATGVLPEEPLSGPYVVEPDGQIILGATYGAVQVAGMTLDEARKAILKHLLDAGFKKPEVRVASGRYRAQQQIRGEHLVRPDGTIGLGIYGSVYVAGHTMAEAKKAIEAHLSEFLEKPEVSVDVFSYNSKVYYIISHYAGYGEVVYRLPATGNETVLDALSMIYGLGAFASKNIWVSRPSPAGHGCDQILPVAWDAIVRSGNTETNYQLLPGDRIFVDSKKWIALDTFMSRAFSPFERLFGIALLGNATVKAIGTPFPGAQ